MYWRRATTELNYRRFFAITDLAGLRVEDPAVFDATHAEVLRWVADGDVDGLRIDHPDGLRRPGRLPGAALREAATGAWTVVEKILEPRRAAAATGRSPAPPGTTRCAEVDGVFVDPAGEAAFTALDDRLTGSATSWPELVHDCKLDVGHRDARAPRCAGWPRSAAELPEAERAARRAAGLLPGLPVVPAGRGRSTCDAALAEAAPAPAGPDLRRAGAPGSPTRPTSWPCGSSRPPAR